MNRRLLHPLSRMMPVVVSVALLAASLAAVARPHHAALADDKVPAGTAVFQAEMRRLWEDHVTWTRLFIVSDLAGLPDAGPTAERLLRNQADIGSAIVPFYGQAAGDQLTALLRDHILVAADLLAAARSGDSTAFEAARARWYTNADDIAAFLAAANPEHWPLESVRAMMHEHLDLTLQEAGARLAGDWSTDIATYDLIHAQALHMADMLSSGIVAQFPKAFK